MQYAGCAQPARGERPAGARGIDRRALTSLHFDVATSCLNLANRSTVPALKFDPDVVFDFDLGETLNSNPEPIFGFDPGLVVNPGPGPGLDSTAYPAFDSVIAHSSNFYLGQTVSYNEQAPEEINKRITNGWKRYWSLKEIFKSIEMSLSIKRKIFITCILPVITYGCKTWSLTNHHRNKLERCQRVMERSMMGIK
ncbi:hypothetical protein EVAR_48481_1 [Eumeta japonica]|uniref:Uncharacterized protein n=1 Tax=Eumeta variegata TaxID=151549 RepID=A0A4C1XFV7_EUMVA|nr:hypothetical protein EVAR_48481_1 [Eumeta japonica]